MTTQCPHCRVPWQGKKGLYGGRSRVVETRTVRARTALRQGKRELTHTVQRLRECLKCRFRWKTREIAIMPARSVK